MPQNKPYSILFCTLLATTESIAHWWENSVNYATGYLKTVSKHDIVVLGQRNQPV